MTTRVDESERQFHYGDGRQPWDDIVDAGWGPAFAAGNVLKYLRRDKQLEHSLASARWYYQQIVRRAGKACGSSDHSWGIVLRQLTEMLSVDEFERLMPGVPDGLRG